MATMYRLYPRLIQELGRCLAQALPREPERARQLLATICQEVTSDQEAVESLLLGLVQASRQNNSRLLEELRQACAERHGDHISPTLEKWQASDARLRELLEVGLRILASANCRLTEDGIPSKAERQPLLTGPGRTEWSETAG